MARSAKVAGKRGGSLAIATRPLTSKESVRVEQIKNGFLITRSGVKNGDYSEEREYSSTDPLAKPKRGK